MSLLERWSYPHPLPPSNPPSSPILPAEVLASKKSSFIWPTSSIWICFRSASCASIDLVGLQIANLSTIKSDKLLSMHVLALKAIDSLFSPLSTLEILTFSSSTQGSAACPLTILYMPLEFLQVSCSFKSLIHLSTLQPYNLSAKLMQRQKKSGRQDRKNVYIQVSFNNDLIDIQ